MQTRKAPRYGLRSAARFACAAALCVATSAAAQLSSPKRDAPPSLPTSGSVVSYQESRSAGIVYHEEKGGLVSAVASPVKPANASPDAQSRGTAVADAKPALVTTPPNAATAAARKARAAPSKVAQAPASPDRARP